MSLSLAAAQSKIARMPWLYLLIAGIMEWGWPIGLKFASMPQHRWWAITMATVSIVLSGVFLLLAQRTIPIGTAYAVWTGIGAVGTFVLGIVVLGEPASLARFFFVGLILVGIAGLKLSTR
jgi:quaternary ammonium compound-resistance protein SugE